MANSNCLEGMACPKCGSEGPFKITVVASALICDEGVLETTNHDWEDMDYCGCDECHHHGTVGDFKINEDLTKEARNGSA